jgi:hypothetical protein
MARLKWLPPQGHISILGQVIARGLAVDASQIAVVQRPSGRLLSKEFRRAQPGELHPPEEAGPKRHPVLPPEMLCGSSPPPALAASCSFPPANYRLHKDNCPGRTGVMTTSKATESASSHSHSLDSRHASPYLACHSNMRRQQRFVTAVLLLACWLGGLVQPTSASAQNDGGDQFLDGIGETALVARYVLNGNTADRSRNGFQATLGGGGATYVEDKQFGQVLSLAGTNGAFVKIPG